jgi:RNA-dependent RNA polymerase
VFKVTFAPVQTADPNSSTNRTHPLTRIRQLFKDYNISIKDGSHFTENPHRPVPVWQWIDFSESGSKKASALLQDLETETYEHLSFEVRYQLEVCLSQGYLSEYTMARDFIRALKGLGDKKGRRLLEFVAAEKIKYLDPMRIFDLQFFEGATNSKVPSYCFYIHTARVTPTTIYYNTPSLDISNRVVREWSSSHSAGRFLRVRFTDEKTEGRINSSMSDSNDEIYTRVKRTLANGITIGSRHYEFLAFGNSQFREHGAYFFSSDAGVSAATIRAWLGQFNHIRNVAKYAARLGQSFSTTRAFTSSSVQTVTCADIERNGFTFSDGVGKISKFLAQLVTEEHKIRTSNGDPPSAYQFRLGGSKGMLVVSADPQPQEVHIRPSQYKFEAKHQGLEIIRWSQYSLATLNRQLILVLSALGIPDRVFHVKQNAMLDGFHHAMSNDGKATELLQKYVDPNQTTLILAKMVNDGFHKISEPFMNTMLGLWKAWHLKHLKEKAKIVIDEGANLLGCIDETGTLKGYFKNAMPIDGSYEERLAALPEIFIQICRENQDGKYKIIEGLCILARNPSLHPGDIRVVRAVNQPELRGLRNVVVLPQTGDQDLAGMCSGGDLDGDDYLVIWDPDLIPTDWSAESMEYKSNKAPDLDHDVTVDEVTSFFVTYMKNDSLPKIAHAHMAWADKLPDGVRSDKCIRLAKLHSDAVDYNKTGGRAVMRRDLSPKLWPHFMEKRYKRKECIYHSAKILGQLYDNVIAPDFVPNLAMSFDSRILTSSLAGASEFYMDFARDLKAEWDMNMRQVMAQYEINTEFEVWSTFVLRHGFVLKDFKMQEDLGKIVGNMRRGFRQICYYKAGADRIASLVVAMYRVTEDQMSAAIKAQQEERCLREDLSNVDINSTELPFITFPWIFPELLGDIAIGKRQASEAEAIGVRAPDSGTNPIFDWIQIRKIIEGMQDNTITKPIVDQVSDSTIPDKEMSGGGRHNTTEDQDSGVCLDEDDDDDDDEDGGVQLTNGDKGNEFQFPYEQAAHNLNEEIEIIDEVDENDKDVEVADKDEGLEIVEKEGDVKPSALDTLINMINN